MTPPSTPADIPRFKLVPPAHAPAAFRYAPLQPGTQTLAKGHAKGENRRAMPEDIIYDRDVTITMRDGVKLYCDVFRAARFKNEKLPAVLAWSPYGKTGTGVMDYAFMGTYNCGIPIGALSGYEKFEAIDPAEFCPRGYALVQPDARGTWNSEGDFAFSGTQEAEDVHDTCEWIASQTWSNGAVGMAGNSWLAISQINVAAKCPPPSLKAIAPWECFADQYKDQYMRGGVPDHVFQSFIQNGFCGNGTGEDCAKAGFIRPLYDDYWRDYTISVEKIPARLPLFQLASYTTMLHCAGSIRSFRKAQSKDKFLRIHNIQEWADLYLPENVQDLDRFFERYLKGVDNGFERETPKVRLSLLGFGTVPDIVNRPETEYPLARQRLVSHYLDAASASGSVDRPVRESTTSYDSDSLTDCVDFYIPMSKYTELVGYPMVELYMSCDARDDLDVHVQLRKADRQRRLLSHKGYAMPVSIDEAPDLNISKHQGMTGRLRASHVVSYNEAASTENEPVYEHDRQEPVTPLGRVVRMRIPVWPVGTIFLPGEFLVVRVAGHILTLPETKLAARTQPDGYNKGRHVVHTGGEYASRVVVPVVEG